MDSTLKLQRQIVEGIKRGDREAFSRLYDAYSSELLAHLVRTVGSREVAEELLHDLFVLVVKKINFFKWPKDGKSSFRSWLFRLATNLGIDHLRKEKRRRAHKETSELETTKSAESEFINEESESVVNSILSKLPANQRLLFGLRVNQEMSYDEISRVSGHSVGAVKQGIFRARVNLKRILGELKEGQI